MAISVAIDWLRRGRASAKEGVGELTGEAAVVALVRPVAGTDEAAGAAAWLEPRSAIYRRRRRACRLIGAQGPSAAVGTCRAARGGPGETWPLLIALHQVNDVGMGRGGRGAGAGGGAAGAGGGGGREK